MDNKELRAIQQPPQEQETINNKICKDMTAISDAPTEDKSVDEVPVEESVLLDITDDMYCGSLPSDLIQDFTCMLCCGIVYEPIKCTTCANMVCKKCVNVK